MPKVDAFASTFGMLQVVWIAILQVYSAWSRITSGSGGKDEVDTLSRTVFRVGQVDLGTLPHFPVQKPI